MCDRNDGIKFSKSGDVNSALFHSRENHRSFRKDPLPIPLNKNGRRRAESHNQVRRVLAIESTKIFDERDFRTFIAGTSGYK